MTVPNGFTSSGRPASLTLVGPAFSDTTLARLAATLTDGGAPTGAVEAGSPPPQRTAELLIAVVGRHLTGESRNGELLGHGAVLAGTARTAPLYRLYRMDTPDGDGLPGLVRIGPDGSPGHPIEVELWRLPSAALGGLLAGVPAPLSVGWVRLHDGRVAVLS